MNKCSFMQSNSFFFCKSHASEWYTRWATLSNCSFNIVSSQKFWIFQQFFFYIYLTFTKPSKRHVYFCAFQILFFSLLKMYGFAWLRSVLVLHFTKSLLCSVQDKTKANEREKKNCATYTLESTKFTSNICSRQFRVCMRTNKTATSLNTISDSVSLKMALLQWIFWSV